MLHIADSATVAFIGERCRLPHVVVIQRRCGESEFVIIGLGPSLCFEAVLEVRRDWTAASRTVLRSGIKPTYDM